jgi:tape measure domain-containing protein
MSTEVDERVVEMRFDNQHFEKNVKTSMSTIERLKKSLNMDGASKSLRNLQTSADNLNFKEVENTACSAGFKIRDVWLKLATVFEYQIAGRIADSITRITKSLTVEPIKTGLQEYETQINSIQTILANTESKGSTLQDVNSALAELNTYADKTIYNFTEMTRNIGTFTAAGVDLDTSVAAIKGIANLAAVSGSTSQQASTAMYQLSQALSSGTVKLQDWNSVVNAGMGGQVFQDSLKETARVHGIAIDDMIKKHGSFRETLSEGWITSEILTETLSKFTGDLSEAQLKSMGYTDEQIKGIIKLGNTANDAATKVKTFTQLFDTLKEAAQSGWTKSWELLIGDFGEAKGLLTDISDYMGDIIGKSADKRNSMLMGGLSSGWKQLLNEGIHDAGRFESTISAVAKQHGVDIKAMVNDETTFQDALRTLLKDGTLTSDVLSESISTFTEKINKMSAEELKASGYTKDQIDKLKELDEGVKNGSVSMERFTELIVRPSGRELLIESLWNTIKALSSVITPVKEAFEEFFPALNGDQLYSAIEAIRNFTAMLTLSETQSKNLKRTFRGVFAVLDIGVQIFKAIAGGFADMIGYIAPAGNGILSFTGTIGDFLVKVNQAVKSSNIFTKIIKGIGSVLKPIGDAVKTFATSVSESFDGIAGTAEKRLGPLSAMGKLLKAMFSGIAALLGKIAPIAGKLAGSIGGAFSNMMSMIADAIQNGDYSKVFDIINNGIFSAIGIFIAKFVKSTGDVVDNFGEIFEGLGDVINSFATSIKVQALKTVATSIAILAGALFVLALIDSEKLTSSLAAITVLFGELIGTLTLFTKVAGNKGFVDTLKFNMMANVMKSLASALLVLAVAMKILGSMSWNEIGVGITGTVVGLGALVTAVKKLPENNVNKAAKTVKKLASSLVILAVAMKIMASMDIVEMGIALLGVGVGLTAIVIAVNKLPEDTKTKVAGLFGLSISLVILSSALKIMASMNIQELGIALLGLVVGLSAMVIAVNKLPEDADSKAGSLFGLSLSLILLSSALKIIASMNMQELVVALLGLGVSLFALVIAINKLPEDTNTKVAGLFGLAASLVVLGAALKIMSSMSWDEIIRGWAAIAGVFVIVGLAALVLQPIVPVISALSGAIALFGVGCLAVGAGVMLFAAGITALAVALSVSGGAIVVFISSLIGLIPFIIEQIGVGIIALCETIAGSADSICKAFTVIVLALVEAIVASVPAIVEGVFVLIESLLTSLVEHAPTIVGALFDFLIVVLNKIAEKLPDLIQAGVNVLMSFLTGVIDALKNLDPEILVKGILAVGFMVTLMATLASLALLAPAAMVGVLAFGVVVAELAVVLAAVGGLSKIPGLEALVESGGNFLQKIGNAIGKFIGGLVGGFMKASSDALPEIATNLSEFIKNLTPFIEGVGNIGGDVVSKMKTLINFAKNIKKFCNKMDDVKASALSKSVSMMRELVDLCKSFPLTNITNASNFGATLEKLAEGGVKKFAGAFTKNSSITDATKSVNTFVDSVIKNVKTKENKEKFSSVGKYLVEGLAEGITNNSSIITVAAQNAAKAAYEAAKKELDINSPSKKFATIGRYVVEGFANGIGANSDLTKDAMGNLTDGLLEYTQDELKIHSPSVVYRDKVGRYIVQGIAEGITKDMSAEEALTKKLENIYSAWEDWNKKHPNGIIDIKTLIMGSSTSPKITNAGTQWAAYDSIYITPEMRATAKSLGYADVYEWLADEALRYGASVTDAYEQAAIDVEDIYSSSIKTLEDKIRSSESKYELESAFTFDSKKKAELKKAYLDEQIDLNNQLAAVYEDEIKLYRQRAGVGSDYEDSFILDLKDKINSLKTENKELETSLNTVTADIASEKAKEITKEYKVTTDRINSDLEMLDSRYEEFASAHPDATNYAKESRLTDYLNSQLNLLREQEENSRKMLNEIAVLSKSDSEEYRKAYQQWANDRVARFNKEKELADIEKQRLQELDKAEDRVRESEYAVWVARNENATEAEKYAREETYLNGKLEDIESEASEIYDEYLKVLEKEGGKQTTEALNLLADWNEKTEEALSLRNQINDNRKAYADSVEKANEDASDSLRRSTYELWEIENQDASEAKKQAVKLAYLEDLKNDAMEDVAKAQEEYIKILNDENATEADIKAALSDLNETKKVVAEYRNQINDTQKEIVSAADEQRELSYDLAKLEYDIWEKTVGRDAKDAEKEAKQLEYLNKQMSIQNGITQAVLNDYNNAVYNHGSGSIEASRAYKAYLDELYNAAELKNQILDLEESAADRQKRLRDKQDLAQKDYDDYIKKYKKYYLANGMSLEDLKRDAKLVTGYDPANVVNNITNKTKTALEAVTTSVNYQSILTGFTDMGNSYIEALNEGITDESIVIKDTTSKMIEECMSKMKKTRPKWIQTGRYLISGFIEGIKSREVDAINAIVGMAVRALKAAKEALGVESPSKEFAEIGRYSVLGLVKGLVDNSGLSDDAAAHIGDSAIESLKNSIRQISDVVNSDLDTQPTIRPVLDLSNIRSGTARLNAMVSNAQAIAISDSRKTRENYDENQNGNDSSTNSGNTYQFTQNNYSPKALSRTEIYRQTKNQFTAMKEVLT